MNIKPRHLKFVNAYIAGNCESAEDAAIAAGYSAKSAYHQGARLCRKPHIQAAIQQALAEQQTRGLIDKDKVLSEVAKIAFCDIRGAFDANGKLLAFKDMPENVRRGILSIKVSPRSGSEDKDGKANVEGGTITSIIFQDKLAALGLLGEHLHLFGDGPNKSNSAARAALLAEASKRADEIKDAKPGAGEV